MSNPFSESPAPSFNDPLGMLRACHGRLERQLETLKRLARHLPEHGSDPSARSAAQALLRYFDHAEPNHHADEEASVFPRLLARAPSARNLVARLEDDHERLQLNWRKLRPLLAGIASGQRANLPPALVHQACAGYEDHLAIENDALLPMCTEWLTPDELAAIGGEMAARRSGPG